MKIAQETYVADDQQDRDRADRHQPDVPRVRTKSYKDRPGGVALDSLDLLACKALSDIADGGGGQADRHAGPTLKYCSFSAICGGLAVIITTRGVKVNRYIVRSTKPEDLGTLFLAPPSETARPPSAPSLSISVGFSLNN